MCPLSFSKCKGGEERAKGSRGYTVIRCGRQWGEKCNDGITAMGGARPGRHCGNNNNNHNRAHKGVTAAAAAARIGPQSLDIVTMVELVNKPCGGAKRRRRRIWTKMRWKHEEEAEEEDITSSSSSFNQTLRSATRSLILTMVVAVVAFQVRKSNIHICKNRPQGGPQVA